ncbi:MAG: hypothetical protein HDR03_11380 [Lachnospiraceae bacterium]|nr:hypothetical protein [Lachnospiraceae bacterium]
MADILDISVFEKGQNCISLGKLSPDMIAFLIEKVPHLSGALSPDTDILFWKDRIKHVELHKKDFISDNEFYNCLKQIPSIITNPDYLSVHPKDNSISFIKTFSSHVSVAIRISSTGTLSFRTMYPIMNAQLTNYIDNGRAWMWNTLK